MAHPLVTFAAIVLVAAMTSAVVLKFHRMLAPKQSPNSGSVPAGAQMLVRDRDTGIRHDLWLDGYARGLRDAAWLAWQGKSRVLVDEKPDGRVQLVTVEAEFVREIPLAAAPPFETEPLPPIPTPTPKRK